MQFLAKGALMIRDAKLLDLATYFDFIIVMEEGKGYNVPSSFFHLFPAADVNIFLYV